MPQYFTPQTLPTRFGKCSTANMPAAVQTAYAALNKLTNEQRLAAMAAFLGGAQAKIDEVWAKGSCSKSEMVQVVQDLCPFK